MAAPHPSDVEFHHPEPRGSTLDIGFGCGDVGFGHPTSHGVPSDVEFRHPGRRGSNVGRWLWPWGRRRCLQAVVLVAPHP